MLRLFGPGYDGGSGRPRVPGTARDVRTAPGLPGSQRRQVGAVVSAKRSARYRNAVAPPDVRTPPLPAIIRPAVTFTAGWHRRSCSASIQCEVAEQPPGGPASATRKAPGGRAGDPGPGCIATWEPGPQPQFPANGLARSLPGMLLISTAADRVPRAVRSKRLRNQRPIQCCLWRCFTSW